MAYAKRKDMFVRVGGEKAQKADEFLTRSQIIPGTNVWFDYLDNYDIRINAMTGGGGGGAGIRMITLEAEVVQKDPERIKHYATEAQDTYSDIQKHKHGTAVFLDIIHNWNLDHKDKFIAQVIDRRPGVVPSGKSMHSLPKIHGVDGNTIRVWATWDYGYNLGGGQYEYNRTNPRFWVSLNDSAKETIRRTKDTNWVSTIKDEPMKNTMLMDPRGYNGISEISDQSQLVTATPYFRISIAEVVE